MDQRVSLVFGRDIKYIEDLVSVMMTSSHALHPQAEELFNLCKQTDPNKLVLRLANLLEESKNVEVRARSAILLGEMFEPESREDEPERIRLWEMFEPLSSEAASSGECKCKPLTILTQNLVKFILLKCVGKERERIVTKSLCHTIATCFNVFCSENGWPELFTFIRQCVSGCNVFLQEAAMLILGPLRLFEKDPPISVQEYVTCLRNAYSVDVRIAAFGAAISYIRCTSDIMDVHLVPAMTQVLTEGLNGGQEVTTQEALKLLIELARQTLLFSEFDEICLLLCPKIYSSGRQLVGFVRSAFEIAESHSLEKETRHLAIDFVIKLGEARNSNFVKVLDEFPYVFNRLFGILMLMLSDIENEAASHWAENEDDDARESRNYIYSVLQEFLDRLAIRLDGDVVVGLVLEQYLATSEWQKRVAAIVALAQISKVYLKVTKKTFNQLVTMVLDSFQDPHPRVRWAAINATGQLSTDLGPDLQVQYHARVLPALAKAVYDFEYPRVQAHAASAMVNMSKNYTPDILTPYLDEIVRRLQQASCQTRRISAINLLKQFRRTLPPATWASIWPTLAIDLQEALQSNLLE